MNNILKLFLDYVKSFINFYYAAKYKSYFKTHHLELTIKDKFNISFTWLSHEQYIKKIKEELAEQEKVLSPEEFIRFSLEKCKQCNFIIFDCDDDDRFVQFWLGDGKIDSSWFITKKSKLKKYTYSMLGVLNEMNIHALNSYPKKPKILSFYIKEKSSEFENYKIYFRKNYDDASNFTILIFKEIFKQDLVNLSCKVE